MASGERFVFIKGSGEKVVAFIPMRDGSSMGEVYKRYHRLFGGREGWPISAPQNLGEPTILGALRQIK